MQFFFTEAIFLALMQDPSVHRNNSIFPIQTNSNLLHLFWVETCYNAPTPTLTDNRKKSFHSIEHSLNFFKLHIYTHYPGRYYIIETFQYKNSKFTKNMPYVVCTCKNICKTKKSISRTFCRYLYI